MLTHNRYVEDVQQARDLVITDTATNRAITIPAGTHMGAMVNVRVLGDEELLECGGGANSEDCDDDISDRVRMSGMGGMGGMSDMSGMGWEKGKGKGKGKGEGEGLLGANGVDNDGNNNNDNNNNNLYAGASVGFNDFLSWYLDNGDGSTTIVVVTRMDLLIPKWAFLSAAFLMGINGARNIKKLVEEMDP